jgi:membrane protein YqaA with SNARE-associated domain
LQLAVPVSLVDVSSDAHRLASFHPPISRLMKSFVTWIEALALQLGGPGLFLIAFLDSSFLSLPQINDLLIIWMVTKNPTLMPWYVTMATLGSIAGCTVMYFIGKKGGDALLRKRFRESHVLRGLALFQRYGVMAILVPAILPPPAPFKIFVMLAGVAKVPLTKFWLAIAIGRGLRYLAEGILAVRYGEQALTFIGAHGREVSLWVAGILLAAGLAFVLWRRLRPRSSPTSAP